MKYRPSWDLSSIPDQILYKEAGRRAGARSSGRRELSCECGSCAVCTQREYRRERRAAGKDLPGVRSVEQRQPENDNRKVFTERERNRTFEAAKRIVADVKKAEELISSKSDKIKTARNPKGSGRKSKGWAPKKAVADALGVSKTTLVNAEQHVETAEQYPFMKGPDCRQSHVLMIGHSSHPWPAFAKLLTDHQVRVLIDVRSSPKSRFPHFNGAALQTRLAELGITYQHAPELGGKDPRPLREQREYIAAMLPLEPGTCLMCSEGDYLQCHRHATLAPLFRALGVGVDHIQPDGTLVADRPTKALPSTSDARHNNSHCSRSNAVI